MKRSALLELTLAHGVTRTQVVLERTAAIITRLFWLGLLSVLVILVLNDSAGLEIQPRNLVAEAAALATVTLVATGG